MGQDTIKNIIDYVSTERKPFEVRGPAGSGKTYTLVQVVRGLEKTELNGVVLSLTNVAVNEINHRFEGNTVSKAMTSHSFAWLWVKRFYHHLLLDSRIEWSQESSWRRLKNNNVKELVFFEDNYSQSYVSQESVNYVQVLDPNLLLKLFSEAIIFSEKFANKIANVIDFLFIDEYQDTDKEFVNSIISALKNRVVIGFFGDPLQKIYPTNGVKNLDNIFGENQIRIFPLLINYRSNPNLLPFFNSLRPEGSEFSQTANSPVTDNRGGNIFIIREPEELSPIVLQKIKDSVPINGPLTMLSPTNIQASIGTANKSMDLIKSLRCLINEDFEELNVKNSDLLLNPHSILPVNNLLALLAITRKYFSYHEVRAISLLFRTPNNFWPLSDIKKARKNLEKSNLNFVESLNLDHNIKAWLKKYLKDLSYGDMLKIYDTLVREPNKDSMTIQKVKGLEFENILVNMDRGTYTSLGLKNVNLSPKNYSETKLANYMFYVAVTRAKNDIVIYINSAKEKEFSKILLEHLNKFSIETKKIDIS